jgi:hypothetical protein
MRRYARGVKLPKWIPHPASWASAVALFFFAIGVSFVFAIVFPILAELMRRSPRLALTGMLVTWLSPIAVAATIHRFASGVLDLADTKARSGIAASVWAGFVAWAAILVVSMTTSFLMLILDPPPAEPDALLSAAWSISTVMTRGVSGIVHSALWVVIAAYVYELDRAAHR